MRESLMLLCESFIENRNIIKKTFYWESTYIYPICAAIFTDKRKTPDRETLRACRSVLKAKTGALSNFRSTGKLAMVSMMAVDSDPEYRLQRALDLYAQLKKHFFTSQYLPLVSMVISEQAKQTEFEEISARTRRIYNLMKSKHPLITSGEDSVMAALLALSDMSDEQIVDETEACYRIMKAHFISGNSVQSLSHVLALGKGSAEEKCEKAMQIFEGLKANGRRYGTGYELATLGSAALLPADAATIVDDILEVDSYLSAQRGYGVFSVGKKQRLMHAGIIVASDYNLNSQLVGAAAVSATISLIVAQQAAMFAAIAASGATSASSGS